MTKSQITLGIAAILLLLAGYAELYRRSAVPFVIPVNDLKARIRTEKVAVIYSTFNNQPALAWRATRIFFGPAHAVDRKIRSELWTGKPPVQLSDRQIRGIHELENSGFDASDWPPENGRLH
ncbi:hypothetical protein [Planctomicrobium piriforme]|uniref:hypothetical protein n=1 Tax=Planctomicrobium piriforme TaxID=1576369 RepID=UPI000B8888C3|nr:hypothetical protein [Planctomicrobium piriforme]